MAFQINWPCFTYSFYLSTSRFTFELDQDHHGFWDGNSQSKANGVLVSACERYSVCVCVCVTASSTTRAQHSCALFMSEASVYAIYRSVSVLFSFEFHGWTKEKELWFDLNSSSSFVYAIFKLTVVAVCLRFFLSLHLVVCLCAPFYLFKWAVHYS